MKISQTNLVLLTALSLSADAFAPTPSLRRTCLLETLQYPKISSSSLKMSDFDFPSAMPEKPVQTPEEKLRDSATSFIADISARLGEGVDPPPELEALKKVRDDPDSDIKTLSLKIYELMIGEYKLLLENDVLYIIKYLTVSL